MSVEYNFLDETIDFLTIAYPDYDIKIDICKYDLSLMSKESLGHLTSMFITWSYKVFSAEKQIIIYATKGSQKEYNIRDNCVLTMQTFFDKNSILNNKLEFIQNNGVKEVMITVETLNGIKNQENEQLYIVKDGHHLMMAAKMLGVQIKYIVEDEYHGISSEELLEIYKEIHGSEELVPISKYVNDNSK